MKLQVHDTTRCLLGEGALWHPERGQLFWCDILSRRVLSRENGALLDWTFDRHVSCLGWVDRANLIVATSTDLTLLNVETDARRTLCDLESGQPGNRSNDGRADPQGGFWVSTMGIAKQSGAGAIYRFHRGELRKLISGISIANSICFTPDHAHAYFADTPRQVILRWRLGSDGWPEGEPQPWIDLTSTDHKPDGAVCDAQGCLWSAQWGSSRVACYGPDGGFRHAIDLSASQVTCPAFGGPDLGDLYCTSATAGIEEAELARNPGHGRTFVAEGAGRGQPEHRVAL